MDEIESLYVSLGVTPDETSAVEAVNKMTDKIKQSLKSSIYGGKKGVITLPATIEGTYKNGKEIEKEIVDAYTAIYNKAKEMADSSVSLTLKDIEDFKKQINKFGKMTAKKRGSDIIANANNNLQQTVSAYQELVTDLKKQVSVQQKQIAKSKPSTKKQKSTNYISDEEIANDIKREQKRRLSGIKTVGPKEYPSGGIDPSKTNTYSLKMSEGSPYKSVWALQQAKTKREEDKKTAASLVTYINKEMAQNAPTGKKTTSQEQDRFMNSNILRQFGASLTDLSNGKEGTIPETVYQNLVAVLKQFSSTNQSLETTFNAIKNMAEYSKSDNPRRRLGSTDGTPKGVGPNDEEAKLVQKAIYKSLDNIWNSPELRESLGFINIFSHSIEEAGKEVKKTTNELKKRTKTNRTSKTENSQFGKRNEELKNLPGMNELAQAMRGIQDTITQNTAITKNELNATETQTSYDKVENTRQAVADSNEKKITTENKDINRDVAKTTKIDTSTGFNTDTNANKLISVAEQILSKIDKPAQNDRINLPETSRGLYKALNSATRLGLPKPDGRRKKISDGLTPEPSVKKSLSLIPVPDMTKALSIIPGEFSKTLKESIHPTKGEYQNWRNTKDSEQYRTTASDDSYLRRLAEESNKRKEMRKKKDNSGERYSPPEVMIPDAEPKHVEKSRVYASPIKQSIWDKFEKALEDATGVTKKYKDIINATAEEQDQYAAERIVKYGLNNGRNPNDTGDIASIKRSLELFRNNKNSIEENPDLAQKIKLTPGREVDTTEVVKKLTKTLSGRQMRNAQMGGSVLRQIVGGATGFIGMPSIEKSRAQADGLNQILGNINKALQSVLINIQTKETELSGMEKSGDAKFDSEGHLQKGSTSAAYKTLADLEEEKLVYDSIKADMDAMDKIIDKTGGKFSKLVKQLSFTSPVLRENNGILRNMNAGLDKNGKALKFQSRTAEILNYTFQLMSRSVGQVFKNWLSMLNPINLIKKAFSDFMSYNTKWQRTMNVIKYNLRAIGRSLMDDIAQKLVNVIGFFDIISMKVQAAFGKMPISLFDQAAADSEKIHEELEAGANVTAGFDELHDIGSDNTGANDLLGEIYKPQLSPEWEKLANDIGDLFAHVIKGDMGFGEVMATIVKLLGETLVLLAKTIWDWFKNTAIGKYITGHWKEILATILTIFLGWKLLKVAGKLLFNALFGNFTENGISSIFSKVGGWITSLLGKSAFGRGIMEGITSLFNGSGGLLSTMKSIFVGHDAITAFGAWGETLGALFAQSLLAVAGVALAGFSLAKGSDKMRKNTAYNVGLESTGGDDKDKKSNVGAGVLSTLGSTAGFAALGTAIAPGIGTAIGAAVGVIAGVINTALAPALEKAAIKAKDMNNEMQKIEYYEGQVQGAQSSVDIFTEQLNLLKQSLDLATQSVYDQGTKLGISKSRMDELIKSTQDGTFNTSMLTGEETKLAGSLTDLAEKQQHTADVSAKLEEAQKRLLKAQTDLSIAQDVEAGNFEVAAARIEVAEMQGVYSTEDATAKRIQLYKQGSEEERKNLLQNLTPEQRKKMLEYNATTDSELKQLNKLWSDSSDEIKSIFTDSIDQETINKFKQSLNSIDSVMAEHQGFWQGVGDTLAEIFTLGHATTYTYNHEDAGYKEIANRLNSGKISKDQVDNNTLTELRKRKLIGFAVGTNYVPNDGLAYLHQGEAVIPKKYNHPYQPEGGLSSEEREYMTQMINTMSALNTTMAQGIPVKGEFKQRGNDLVAVVEKANNRNSNNILSNRVYAR